MAIYFNSTGETKEIATYQSCIALITLNDPNNWGNTYSASNGSVMLTVPSNSTSSSRNETITISYYAGNTSCSKTIDISQDGGSTPPTPTTCSEGVTVGLGGTCVSAQASSTPIKLGTWSKTPSDCTNSWQFDTTRTVSGTAFIDPTSLDFRSNGDIYGVITGTNQTSSSRECKIPTKLGSFTDYFTITQCAGSTPTPTCDCSTFGVTGSSQSVSSAASSTEYTLATYTTASNCSEPLSITHLSGTNFMGNFRYSSGSIYGKVISANTSSARQSVYSVSQGNCNGTFTVTQNAGSTPVQSVFEWQVAGHQSHYDVSVLGAATYFSPEMFTSTLNGESVNGVMTSNVSWITVNSPMYINNNELKPNLNNTVYLTPNTTDNARSGTLTLTQKGGTSTITVTVTQGAYVPNCMITAFTMDSTACKDSSRRLYYTFDVADTRCTQNFNFTLYDSNGTAIQSSSTPSGGHGSGYFDISNAHVGNATCVVTVNNVSVTKTCNIQMCTFTATFQITNGLPSTEACVDKIDIVTNGGTITLSDMGECLRPGSTTRFVHDLSYTLSGLSFSSIILRDTLVSNKTYSTNYGSGTLEETTYPITIQSELTRNLLLESNEEETEENNEEEIENTNESE